MTTFTGQITATDGSGQTAIATVIINEVTSLTVAYTVSPLTGPPGTTFTITATASGGQVPYSYSIGQINGITPTPVAGTPGKWTITL